MSPGSVHIPGGKYEQFVRDILHSPIILVLGRLMQEDLESEARLELHRKGGRGRPMKGKNNQVYA